MRARRHALGVSQERFAAQVGVHRTYVSAIERGHQNVALANILRIARALDVPAASLVAEADRASR